jgi:hypothetical protein
VLNTVQATTFVFDPGFDAGLCFHDAACHQCSACTVRSAANSRQRPTCRRTARSDGSAANRQPAAPYYGAAPGGRTPARACVAAGPWRLSGNCAVVEAGCHRLCPAEPAAAGCRRCRCCRCWRVHRCAAGCVDSMHGWCGCSAAVCTGCGLSAAWLWRYAVRLGCCAGCSSAAGVASATGRALHEVHAVAWSALQRAACLGVACVRRAACCAAFERTLHC